MKNFLAFSVLTITFILSLTYISSAQTPLLSDNITNYFSLDETSGNAINLVNSLPGAVPQGEAIQGVSGGIINNAYSFYGGSDSLSLINPAGVCIFDNSCTISFWIKHTSTLSRAVYYQGSSNSNLHDSVILYVLDASPPGAPTLQIRGPSGGPQAISSPFSISDNNWHHVVIVGDGTVYSLYTDGILANQAISLYTPQTTSPIETFGDRPGGDNWNGQIDEIGIWNRALSSSEVSQLYNNGNGLPYSNLSILLPQPPVLSQIGNKQTLENQTLSIQLQATDPNPSDNLTFLTNAPSILPSLSFLNSSSGLFTWTPNYQDSGVYNVTFYVTDGQFLDSETINIKVVDVSFATISVVGTPSLGNQIHFNIQDPEHPNHPFIFAGAFGSSPGIDLGDGRIIPLNNDWLFNALIFVPQLFGFSNSIGVLDNQGNAQVNWNIPIIPGAQGLNLPFSFVTINNSYSGAQSIRSIAPVNIVTLQ